MGCCRSLESGTRWTSATQVGNVRHRQVGRVRFGDAKRTGALGGKPRGQCMADAASPYKPTVRVSTRWADRQKFPILRKLIGCVPALAAALGLEKTETPTDLASHTHHASNHQQQQSPPSSPHEPPVTRRYGQSGNLLEKTPLVGDDT